MKPLFFERPVGIFGLGLLGGSVALGLRERFLVGEVHGYDPDPASRQAALDVGAVDVVHDSLGDWITTLEAGVLAAPVGVLAKLGADIAPFAAPESLWTDVGGVKAPIVDALHGLLPNFVGSHPMAGSEHVGCAHARAALLENAVWVITPHPDTPWALVDRVKQVIDAMGAYPLLLNPELHDRLVARVSHLPYLLAVALSLMVGRDKDHEQLMFLAAGGFRDLTRVASGSPHMSRDMVAVNREAIKEALADLQEVLGGLSNLLDDPNRLLDYAVEAKATRDALPIVKRSLLPRMYDVVVGLPDQPGELARLTGCCANHDVNIRDIEVLTIREEGEAIRLGFHTPEERDQARTVLRNAGYVLP